ncbi:conserved hypothetical protein [Herbaspirillum seropedicae SmR1]|uniref:Uncharacterized protein n=1 Tax=Herbaspirillum seropedicae (strain SmR1) TaxID=757424 RepID=D8IZU9_HERSS|nr:conserved hypothetical protein [Herbaspirillum seropedicae SmR1]
MIAVQCGAARSAPLRQGAGLGPASPRWSDSGLGRFAADGVELDLDELTARVLGIALFQRQLVGAARFIALALGQQHVALAVSDGAGELRRVVAAQHLERLVIGLGVQQDTGQTNRRDGLVFLATAVVDHPLQLLLGSVGVIGVEGRLGRHQGAHLGVGGAAELVLDIRGGALHLGVVLGRQRLLLLFIQHRGLRRLAALVGIPTGPASIASQRDDQHPGDQVAVFRPPGLDGVELFLFFEIVCHLTLQ